ncbi:tRNA lysidine(34) synthetase TilS [Thermocrinis sp.]|jgi:tRNA(Ile)-lysidine synthase|uniref:tRNA lysidine(34) synthetase TilS n=2 Tax=Thermocrinis sp. TaxID=2024383 RepID=UPI002605E1A6|nr:tRNA lysidine(34) synthetase TilS [Thermocrinis sp.]
MAYHSLLRKVITLQRKTKLIPPNSAILVAFSGGIDSSSLAIALQRLKEPLKIKRLALLHINHLLRGEESYRDENFARSFAQKYSLELFVERVDVPSLAKKRGGNIEAVAREERYRLFEEVRKREGFDLVATAHHLGDLVETIILWLTRGTGLEGLLGFEPKEGNIVRPFYLATRQEIEDFAKKQAIEWVEDSTNYDLSLARNRIRHRVVPELKAINPNLEESVLRMREILKEENELLEKLVQTALLKVKEEGREGFLKLEPALQRRVVMKLYGVKNFKEVSRIINRIKKGDKI